MKIYKVWRAMYPMALYVIIQSLVFSAGTIIVSRFFPEVLAEAGQSVSAWSDLSVTFLTISASVSTIIFGMLYQSGLAWTSAGGDTLEIEVNLMPGKGNFELTGQLGGVMQESAKAGISYIRSVSEKYELDRDYFQEHDIHIHIPEGAVPKDGPSAGITMATAMLSAILEKPVRADVAMTGEITLRGRVLPIGGLKEKLLAAKSAGMRTVIVPEKNRRDVEELSKEITGGLELVYAGTMETVLSHAFA